jgi:hypothetical protein
MVQPHGNISGDWAGEMLERKRKRKEEGDRAGHGVLGKGCTSAVV